MNGNSLATILSLIDVNNIPVVRVTMDAMIEKAMNVVLGYVTVFKFKSCVSGLYYYDVAITDVQYSAKNNSMVNPYSLLSTVNDNK